MGLLDAVEALIKAGVPESTAVKIASGELPMDTASRMARASEQGYGPVLYHGSTHDITQFDGLRGGSQNNFGAGSYFTDSPSDASYNYAGTGGADFQAKARRIAKERASYTDELIADVLPQAIEDLKGSNQGVVYPVRVKQGGLLTVTESLPDQVWDDIGEIMGKYGIAGDIMPGEADVQFVDRILNENAHRMTPEEIRVLGKYAPQNYSGVIDTTTPDKFKAMGAGTHTVVFPGNENQIRSVNAAFDPDYTGPNILGLQGSTQKPSLLTAAANSATGGASLAVDQVPKGSNEDQLYQGLTDKMVDYLTAEMGGSEKDRQRAELISLGMDFLPVVGAAKGVSETFDAYKNDDTLGMALGAGGTLLGMIPFGRAAFKGVLGMVEDAPTVTRDTPLLQRVGDPDSVNQMKLEVEPGADLLPSQPISAADLEGRGFVSGMADTSRGDLSRVVAVNDQPIDMVRFGGQDYMRQPSNVEQGILWASDAGQVTGLTNAARAAAELPGATRGPLYIPYQMGPQSTDFATMTADIMVPIAKQNLSKAKKKALDKRIRSGAGNKTADMKPLPDWPGIDSPKVDDYLANAGGDRKAVTKAIDEFRDDAGINLSQARAAIVDAEQMAPRVGNLRQAGVLDLARGPQPGRHPSYNTDLMGQYLGQFGEGANLLEDLTPLVRSTREPFVPLMLERGHDLSGAKLPAPVGKAMQPGLIGMFDTETIDQLIKKGLITP